MVRCDLEVMAKFPYGETEQGQLAPVLPVLIHREGMERSISTEVLVDSGYDGGLVLSPEIRDILFAFGDSDREDSLGAGDIEIPCDAFLLEVKILDEWYNLEGFAPKEEGYETILGREVLNNFVACLRGPQKETIISAVLKIDGRIFKKKRSRA